MSKKIYVAVIRRKIVDEVELQIEVHGDMSQLEIERRAQEMAGKLSVFDPMSLSTQIATNLVVLDLVTSQN